MALFVGQKRLKDRKSASRGFRPTPQAKQLNRVNDDASSISSDGSSDGPLPSTNYDELLSSLTRSRVLPKRRKLTKTASAPALPPSPDPKVSEEQFSAVSEDSESDNDGFEEDKEDDVSDRNDPFDLHFGDLRPLNRSYAITPPQAPRWATTATISHDAWCCTLKSIQNLAASEGERAVTLDSKQRVKYLKQKLRQTARTQVAKLDDVQDHLCGTLFNYTDILFPLRSAQSASAIRDLACIHVLNHVLKTRSKILRNNARMATKALIPDGEYQDQGFTRPKVAILLPTRQTCVRYLETMMRYCEPEQQENKKRFLDTFSSDPNSILSEKPDDFRELFDGHDDDLFRIGIKFTRRTVKLFSSFYHSDIILASPLGLRMAIQGGNAKQEDCDFLSSLEVVVIDQADALLMQNWEHVEFVLNHMNLQPKEAHGCDFSRVKAWYLDGKANHYRQTVAFSSFNFPGLNKLFASMTCNLSGKALYSGKDEGVMARMSIQPRQTFSRLAVREHSAEPDTRFQFFLQTLMPSLAKLVGTGHEASGTLLFISSYTDFLRVRNHLAAGFEGRDIAFGAISEYTSVADTARYRSHFISGKYSILLYTERAHHFRRYQLKGVRNIVFYSLPENPIFYKEIVEGYLSSSLANGKVGLRDTHVRVTFSRFDLLRLERIVGSERHLSMLKQSEGDIFDFV